MMDAAPHTPASCLCGARNVNVIGTGMVLSDMCNYTATNPVKTD